MNCRWSRWGSYSACSVTCGGGKQTRKRTKLVVESHGGICHGLSYQYATCNTDPCLKQTKETKETKETKAKCNYNSALFAHFYCGPDEVKEVEPKSKPKQTCNYNSSLFASLYC